MSEPSITEISESYAPETPEVPENTLNESGKANPKRDWMAFVSLGIGVIWLGLWLLVLLLIIVVSEIPSIAMAQFTIVITVIANFCGFPITIASIVLAVLGLKSTKRIFAISGLVISAIAFLVSVFNTLAAIIRAIVESI